MTLLFTALCLTDCIPLELATSSYFEHSLCFVSQKCILKSLTVAKMT